MDKDLINKKIEFMINRISDLEPFRNSSIDEIKKDIKTLKYLEKTIQELVDAAVDINEHVVESKTKERPWSAKQSFFKIQDFIFVPKNIAFENSEIKLIIDTISFRNEIVHSYDVNVYIIWSKRNLETIINIYKKYIEKINKILK